MDEPLVARSSCWKSCWVAHWAHDRQPTVRTKFKFMWFNGCETSSLSFLQYESRQPMLDYKPLYMVMVPLCILGYHQLCLYYFSPRWETLMSTILFECLAVVQTFALDPGYGHVDRVLEGDQCRRQWLRFSRHISSPQIYHSRCISNEGDPIG